MAHGKVSVQQDAAAAKEGPLLKQKLVHLQRILASCTMNAWRHAHPWTLLLQHWVGTSLSLPYA